MSLLYGTAPFKGQSHCLSGLGQLTPVQQWFCSTHFWSVDKLSSHIMKRQFSSLYSTCYVSVLVIFLWRDKTPWLKVT